MILLPDTHFFLHFRDARELPWHEITPDSEIKLIVCRTIQREIDKKKYELRGRAQKRARQLAGLLGDIIERRAPVILREGSPRVTLDFCSSRPRDWTPPSILQDGWGDDMLVADALAYNTSSSEAATILTGDVGVYGTAEDHGVAVCFLKGKEHWLLAEELDDRDKKIRALKAEVERLRQNSPAIALQVKVDGTDVRKVPVRILRYTDLPPERIKPLIEELKRNCPLVTDFSKPQEDSLCAELSAFHSVLKSMDWGDSFEDRPPTQDAIRAYAECAYPEWLNKVENHLRNLSGALNENEIKVRVSFYLSNQGTVPAEGVMLEFQALGNFILAKTEQNLANDENVPNPSFYKLPSAPLAPEWRRVKTPGPISVMEAAYRSMESIRVPSFDDGLLAKEAMRSLNLNLLRRTPHKFYTDNDASSPNVLQRFTCDDFRHQSALEEFSLTVLLDRDNLPRGDAGIRVKLSARNMRDNFEQVVPISITVQDDDVESKAKSLIKQAISQHRLDRRLRLFDRSDTDE